MLCCQKQHAEFSSDALKIMILIEDKERSGTLKKFEDEELEALLYEDSYQTLAELAESLGVTQQFRNV